MSTVTEPPTLDPAITQRNFDALARAQPDLWQKLHDASAALPPTQPAWARDGCISLRVQSGPDAWTWLGNSSIPSVRGKAILERFEVGQGNVFLPGIAAGYEVDQLLKALAATRAVFVWEQDPAQYALALRLYDWSAAIATGRLILLTCDADALTSCLLDWLRQHPGHLHPDRILAWPWSTPSDLADIRSAVQAACQTCERERAAQLARLRPTLASAAARRTPPPSGTDAKVALIGVSAQDEIRQLADALHRTGVQGVKITPHTPADVHPLAMAARMVEAAPEGFDVALTLGHTRRAVQTLLPDELPVVSWLSAAPAAEKKASHGDFLAVTEGRHRDEAIRSGWPAEQITVLPYPCLADLARAALPEDRPRPLDLVIFANLSLTNPEAYGIKLASHVHFWQTAVNLLADRIDHFTDDQTPALLKSAAAQSGVGIDNPQLLQQMATCLAAYVARTFLWRHLMAVLSGGEAKIAVYGHGWEVLGPHIERGPIPGIGERVEILGQAKALLLADPCGEVGPNPLLAAAAGALVVSRLHPNDRRPGGLATLLAPGSEMAVFRQANELPPLLRHTIRADARRQALIRRAYERCATQHTPQVRWKELWTAASAYFARQPGQS